MRLKLLDSPLDASGLAPLSSYLVKACSCHDKIPSVMWRQASHFIDQNWSCFPQVFRMNILAVKLCTDQSNSYCVTPDPQESGESPQLTLFKRCCHIEYLSVMINSLSIRKQLTWWILEPGYRSRMRKPCLPAKKRNVLKYHKIKWHISKQLQ